MYFCTRQMRTRGKKICAYKFRFIQSFRDWKSQMSWFEKLIMSTGPRRGYKMGRGVLRIKKFNLLPPFILSGIFFMSIKTIVIIWYLDPYPLRKIPFTLLKPMILPKFLHRAETSLQNDLHKSGLKMTCLWQGTKREKRT